MQASSKYKRIFTEKEGEKQSMEHFFLRDAGSFRSMIAIPKRLRRHPSTTTDDSDEISVINS